MPQTTFYTTYSNNLRLILRAENGSECGLHGAVSYRFGFNGQEMDNEITGQTGTHTTAMFWEYDCRLGRRWNLDPVVKPWESSYACFNSNSIYNSDFLGNDGGPSSFRKFVARLNPWEMIHTDDKGNKTIRKCSFYIGGKKQMRMNREVKNYRVYTVVYLQQTTVSMEDKTQDPQIDEGSANTEVNLFKFSDLEEDKYNIYQPDEKGNKTYVNDDPNLRSLPGDADKAKIECSLIPDKSLLNSQKGYDLSKTGKFRYLNDDDYHIAPYAASVIIEAVAKPVYVKVPKYWWGGNNWKKAERNYIFIKEGKDKDKDSGTRQRFY